MQATAMFLHIYYIYKRIFQKKKGFFKKSFNFSKKPLMFYEKAQGLFDFSLRIHYLIVLFLYSVFSY